MSIYSYFQIAFKELKRQPAFSLLAVFALMIGTTLVTVFSAMFDFNRQAYILIARSIGARELTVTPIGSNTSFIDLLGPPVVKVQDIQSSIVVFSLKDLELAKTSVPHLDYAYAKQNIAFIPMNSSKSIEGMAITEEFIRAANVRVSQGALFTAGDFKDSRNVVLISSQVTNLLLPDSDVVGTRLVLGDLGEYQVIGVLDSKWLREQQLNISFLTPFGSSQSLTKTLETLTFATKDLSEFTSARSGLATYATEKWGNNVIVRTIRDVSAKSRGCDLWKR